MIQRIFTALLNIFQNIQTPVVPNKIGFNYLFKLSCINLI